MDLTALVAFGLTVWLGLYLVARGRASGPTALAGGGALTYSGVILIEWLAPWAAAGAHGWLDGLRWLALGATGVCWALAVWQVRRATPTRAPRGWLGLIVVATVFFGLGLGLYVIPRGSEGPPAWIWLSVCVDVLALGWAVAVLDAFETGERAGRDLLRSGLVSAVAAGTLAAPVVWGTRLLEDPSLSAALSVAAVIALTLTGLALQPVAQAWLDRLIFRDAPQLRQERAELRAVSDALPRLADDLDLLALDAAEFTRLTRRALSQLNDPGRLASSPLTRLPLVRERLRARQASDDTLERARELRAVLVDKIQRLRPLEAGPAGTGDEWRHYNALYFPDVVGLRPYAAGADHHGLPSEASRILAWFQTAVPERTLYNWQSTAARLIADDLRRP